MDELSGTPEERSRGRNVVMNGSWFLPGQGASALDFGVNTGEMIPSILANNWTPAGTRNTTLEFWIQPGTLTSGQTEQGVMSINGKADTTDTRRIAWYVSMQPDNTLQVFNGMNSLSTPALSDGWHHIALVRRYNGTVLLYLDGDEVASTGFENHGRLVPVVMHLGAKCGLPSGVTPAMDLTG